MQIEALNLEVVGFRERVQSLKSQGLRGSPLVKEVVQDWESTVKKTETGEKVILCGKAARWWDGEIKNTIKKTDIQRD